MDTRRDFVKKMIGGIIMPGMVRPQNISPYISFKRPMRTEIDNPYADVNWNTFNHITSTSHVHVENQEKLNKYYNNFGLRHMPISNYYPSAPYYPIRNIRENQFKVQQDFGVMYNNRQTGEKKFIEGPIYWNEIIMDQENGWHNELSSDQKSLMPFDVGERLFPDIPENLIVSPNAEHHSFIDNPRMHVNSLGSLYSSGTFDSHSQYKTTQHGYSFGTGKNWREVFRAIFDQLLLPDGGGITINHPTWSGINIRDIYMMLDFEDRVLGIEVFNDSCCVAFGDPTGGWALELWDEILKSGRRCLGFFVPDHTIGRGRNILLVKNFTEHECLKAYRKGAFYGVLNGSGLGFNNISINDYNLIVETNKECTIRIITNKGMALRKSRTTRIEYEVPFKATGGSEISYLRIEANDESSELIYSQPIRFISKI